MVVCNDAHRFMTRRQLQEIGLHQATLIAEPVGRNTAPALTLAALSIADPEAVMLVMPADHVIPDAESFRAATEIAVLAAHAGGSRTASIVTFGIVPTEPEIGRASCRERVYSSV